VTDLEPLIAQNPFFEGFSKEHLKVIVGCASNVAFKNDEFIFREKQPANTFYIIRHGKVALQVFAPGSKQITIEENRSAGHGSFRPIGGTSMRVVWARFARWLSTESASEASARPNRVLATSSCSASPR
jgi:hypothetical protein